MRLDEQRRAAERRHARRVRQLHLRPLDVHHHEQRSLTGARALETGRVRGGQHTRAIRQSIPRQGRGDHVTRHGVEFEHDECRVGQSATEPRDVEAIPAADVHDAAPAARTERLEDLVQFALVGAQEVRKVRARCELQSTERSGVDPSTSRPPEQGAEERIGRIEEGTRPRAKSLREERPIDRTECAPQSALFPLVDGRDLDRAHLVPGPVHLHRAILVEIADLDDRGGLHGRQRFHTVGAVHPNSEGPTLSTPRSIISPSAID